MSHWMALVPQPLPDTSPSTVPDLRQPGTEGTDLARHLGWQCLRFTPRVALLEEAVLMEVQASLRLFGGWPRLRDQILAVAQPLCPCLWADAPTARGALALARAGGPHDGHPWPQRLDGLPLGVLAAVAAQAPTLARLGCRTLGDVRALPRGGLSRRLGAALLQELDQAFGQQPEGLDWLTLPPRFDLRVTLPHRAEHAADVAQGAAGLMHALCAWLAGQQAGVQAFVLHWYHDTTRHQRRQGQHAVRLAHPSRNPEHLLRLLQEHLAHIQLDAPVEDLRLAAQEIVALPHDDGVLFPESGHDGAPTGQPGSTEQRQHRAAWVALLEQLSARLGAGQVRQARLRADPRLECAQHWQPALALQSGEGPRRTPPGVAPPTWPWPTWLLPDPLPLPLATQPGHRPDTPSYQGPLHLLAGPHRIEAGWWPEPASAQALHVARDYYLASSPGAGLLWVFRTRQLPTDHHSPWYLHGFFA